MDSRELEVLVVDSRPAVGFVAGGTANRFHVAFAGDPAHPVADLGARTIRVLGDVPMCIGVLVGPGSVTAVRAGVGFVKALGMTWNVPIVPFTPFDVIGEFCRLRGVSWAAERVGTARLALAHYSEASAKPDSIRLVSQEEIEALSEPVIDTRDVFDIATTMRYVGDAAKSAVPYRDVVPLYLRELGARRAYVVRGSDGKITRVGS